MIEFIIVYISMALATSLVCWWYLFWPAVRDAQLDEIENDITRSPYLSSIVFVIINTILAPLVIFAIFVPSAFEGAKQGITKAIREP